MMKVVIVGEMITDVVVMMMMMMVVVFVIILMVGMILKSVMRGRTWLFALVQAVAPLC